MKALSYSKLLAAALLLTTAGLTSCIEETEPESSTATAEQLGESAKATEALLSAPAAFLNNYGTYSSGYHYDWGYGSIMHARDVMTSDMVIVSSGYNWYDYWCTNSYLGESYVPQRFIWQYFYQAIQTANNLIDAIDYESASDAQKGMYGVGCAWRALFYLDAAQMYEYLPCDVTSNITTAGNDITNLTIPIVTESTTEEEARNNPRATREEMFDFILADLDSAENNIEMLDESLMGYSTPSLTFVYGLKARLYLWVEDYDNAATYALAAINEGTNTPMTESQQLDTSTGFNTPVSSWILCSQQTQESSTVTSGILNWTSWVSNETTFGYCSAGPFLMIGSDLYNKISNDDYRKLLFKAPTTSPLYGTEPIISQSLYESMPTYSSLKFRPGNGNADDYLEGAATSYPVMRIEEMYFIYAEALAHSDPAAGKTVLENFVKNYRYSSYTCSATSQNDVIDEILTQKSIELFGEGLMYFDIKRLNKSVDRTINTNGNANENFVTDGRPAWMNICITRTEKQNNTAIQGYENPDPSDLYTPVAQ